MNRRGFTLIEGIILFMIVTILVSIAIPNFMERRNRSKLAKQQGISVEELQKRLEKEEKSATEILKKQEEKEKKTESPTVKKNKTLELVYPSDFKQFIEVTFNTNTHGVCLIYLDNEGALRIKQYGYLSYEFDVVFVHEKVEK